jgi:hypothetical protein|tara:strand:- start:72 stop:230 length:159 start_codon:yes stop_codon:yes gene_type:complete
MKTNTADGKMKEEYFDEPVSDEDELPQMNWKDCDDEEQIRQRVQSFFMKMGW